MHKNIIVALMMMSVGVAALCSEGSSSLSRTRYVIDARRDGRNAMRIEIAGIGSDSRRLTSGSVGNQPDSAAKELAGCCSSFHQMQQQHIADLREIQELRKENDELHKDGKSLKEHNALLQQRYNEVLKQKTELQEQHMQLLQQHANMSAMMSEMSAVRLNSAITSVHGLDPLPERSRAAGLRRRSAAAIDHDRRRSLSPRGDARHVQRSDRDRDDGSRADRDGRD